MIIGYSCFTLYDFVRGPRIIIYSPLDGFSTTTPYISVTGRGIHTSSMSINDDPTAVDLAGNFESRLLLAPGYNIIKVAAKDNYGRSAEKTIETVLVVPQVATATTTQEGSLLMGRTDAINTTTSQGF